MTRERATVLVSALAAIAILGAAVTAQPSRTSPRDRLARLEADLRYQLDLGSRLDRPAFEARTKELESVLEAWRKSPQSQGDYELITGWLREAIVQSLPGESGEWPATPAFSSERVARKAVASEGERGQRSEVGGQKENTPLPLEAPRAVAANTTGVAPSAKQIAPKQPPLAKATAPVRTPDRPVASEDIVKKPAPQQSITAREAPSNAAKFDVANRPAPTLAQTAKAYGGVKARPVGTKPQAAKTEPITPVQVNLAELNARIGGYHEGLREIEAAVVASREGMTVGQVARLVGQLEQLAGQYQFVRLYHDALTRDERHFVMTPRAMAPTIELVERERSRVEAASDDDFLAANEPAGEESELAARLKALSQLSGK